MVDMASITAAIGGIKTAYEGGKRLFDGAVDSAVKQQVQVLMEQLQSARESVLNVKEQMLQMKEHILELEDAEKARNQFDRYELKEVYKGTKLYALKPEFTETEPAHYICPTCHEAGHKHILQPLGQSDYMVACGSCKQHFYIKDEPPSRNPRNDYDPYAD